MNSTRLSSLLAILACVLGIANTPWLGFGVASSGPNVGAPPQTSRLAVRYVSDMAHNVANNLVTAHGSPNEAQEVIWSAPSEDLVGWLKGKENRLLRLDEIKRLHWFPISPAVREEILNDPEEFRRRVSGWLESLRRAPQSDSNAADLDADVK
jgi:hypothetical protein